MCLLFRENGATETVQQLGHVDQKQTCDLRDGSWRAVWGELPQVIPSASEKDRFQGSPREPPKQNLWGGARTSAILTNCPGVGACELGTQEPTWCKYGRMALLLGEVGGTKGRTEFWKDHKYLVWSLFWHLSTSLQQVFLFCFPFWLYFILLVVSNWNGNVKGSNKMQPHTHNTWNDSIPQVRVGFCPKIPRVFSWGSSSSGCQLPAPTDEGSTSRLPGAACTSGQVSWGRALGEQCRFLLLRPELLQCTLHALLCSALRSHSTGPRRALPLPSTRVAHSELGLGGLLPSLLTYWLWVRFKK